MDLKNTLAARMAAFSAQADEMIAARQAKHGDLRMELIDNDEGGAPGDDDDSDDDADDDDQDGEPGDDDADGDKGGKDKDKDKDDDKVDRSEYERVKRHRAAADRRVATLESENAALKTENAALKKDGKDGKPDEATTARVTELESKVQKKDSTIQELRIQNAFLTANTHEWADVEDAMRLADLSDVEIEEDGTVVGLKEALNKLAKAKPHLLKKSSGSGDDKKGPSGSANNGRRKGDSKKPDRAALSRTYPVLAARR